MAQFTGTLTSNEIFGSLFNMIISQQVFGDNIKGTNSSLVEKARVDGSMYGDTKLYYATDVLKTSAWGADDEAANLLALHRPTAPKCQAIKLDVFRQICLTLDNYMSKRAFSTEGAFTQFNSVMQGWIAETKKVYDSTLYNTYIGTTSTNKNGQDIMLDIDPISETGEEAARISAQKLAEGIEKIMISLKDINRINDYGYLRSYDESDLIVVWNADWAAKIKKVDLPTIYHAEKVFGDFENMLPGRYFGAVKTASGTTGANNTTVRALVEKDFGGKHCFPGDLLPNSAAYGANETYEQSDQIICKIIHKDSVPYMSGFEVGTSFFNAKSLTETNYLTFGHNTLAYLEDKPFITVQQA